jgi:NAD(P)-dependent dehydrogenase (short-subunit alcohol dehydrogenase family)
VGAAIADALEIDGFAVTRHSRTEKQGVWAWDMARPLPALPARPVTHLVLNASHFERGGRWDALPGEAVDRELDVLDRHLTINVAAQLRLALALHGRDRLESIVILLDTYLDRSFPQHSAYLISRAAGYGLVRALATELAPDCRVNAVAPGTVLASTRAAQDRAESAAEAAGRPLLGAGSPGPVVDAVRFLLTASYTTGEVLRVDGGRFRV